MSSTPPTTPGMRGVVQDSIATSLYLSAWFSVLLALILLGVALLLLLAPPPPAADPSSIPPWSWALFAVTLLVMAVLHHWLAGAVLRRARPGMALALLYSLAWGVLLLMPKASAAADTAVLVHTWGLFSLLVAGLLAWLLLSRAPTDEA